MFPDFNDMMISEKGDSWIMIRYGLATCFYPQPSADRWRAAAAAGFTEAEIDTDKTQSTEQILAHSQLLFDQLQQAGLRPTSFHLPFGHRWDVSAPDAQLRHQVLQQLKQMLQWCGQRGITTAVLHASYEPVEPQQRQSRCALAADSVTELAQAAQEYGLCIAVENLPRSCLGNCAEELRQIIGSHRNVGVCFDVNHLLGQTHREFVSQIGHRIITTHLSDYDGQDEKHWMPGEGCIDWAELRVLLEEAGYQGRLLFELGNDATPSFACPITARQLMERFQQLYFAGKERKLQ